jgi:hypothetical protein
VFSITAEQPPERLLPGQQLVQYHAGGPDVGAQIDRLAVNCSGVGWRAVSVPTRHREFPAGHAEIGVFTWPPSAACCRACPKTTALMEHGSCTDLAHDADKWAPEVSFCRAGLEAVALDQSTAIQADRASP